MVCDCGQDCDHRVVYVDVVRVFVDERGDFGNELGIVQADATVEGKAQQIAAELGFSETVFVSDAIHGCASMRIFTPAAELPFAGHPSVGAAWWFARRGESLTTLVVPAGDIVVRYEGDLTWIAGQAAWAPEFVMHPKSAPPEVDALAAAAFVSGHHYAWAWIDEDAGVIRARMFAPGLGVAEDEATGSAAVRITTQLERDLTIRQGAGSVLHTRWLDGPVEVGGCTVFDRTLKL